MDIVAARDRLAEILRSLARSERTRLDELQARASELEQPDFLWRLLLESFATMLKASGYDGLIGNLDNYKRVTYDALEHLTPEGRASRVRDVCRAAKLRMPDLKAEYILGCFEKMQELGGPEEAKAALLAEAEREGKIRFLRQLPGIGDKYARNIMMTVYHEVAAEHRPVVAACGGSGHQEDGQQAGGGCAGGEDGLHTRKTLGRRTGRLPSVPLEKALPGLRSAPLYGYPARRRLLPGSRQHGGSFSCGVKPWMHCMPANQQGVGPSRRVGARQPCPPEVSSSAGGSPFLQAIPVAATSPARYIEAVWEVRV